MKTKTPLRQRCLSILNTVLLVLVLAAIAGYIMSDQPEAMASAPAGSPEELAYLRRNGNALKGEKSLYLQQHAYNPLAWYPWGEAALERSRLEDKPIFLSIGYSSCHWCHVMEHEVFEHDDIAAFMNANFICIKVDREERPDLDAVYMDAVMAMTGRGGWPMSVFLTPDLQPFYGGTYYPHDVFLELAQRVDEVFRKQRDLIQKQGRELTESLNRNLVGGKGGAFTARRIDALVESALQGVDSTWGGFQQSQKFPTTLRWRFLLHQYQKHGGVELGRALRLTLDRIADGGIHDQLGGGFHRYTVEQTWLVPHFEIMLYDNAQLAEFYLEAASVFDDPGYLETGAGVLDFLIREMTAPRGGIHASFDADSGGEEGSYYVWTPRQINAIAGDHDGPPLAALLGVTGAGNFEGASILTRRVAVADVAQRFSRSEAEIAALFDTHRMALHAARLEREAPTLDRKIVTAWNGLGLSAFARGYAVTGREAYREAAAGIVDYLWEVHRDPDGRLYRASTGGQPTGAGIIDDYAFFAEGLIDLYQATGASVYITRALQLIDAAEALFADRESEGFFMTAEDVPTPLGRRRDLFDNVEPSGIAVLLRASTRAAALAGDVHRHDRVAGIVERHADLIDRAGLEMAWWADVADMHLGDFHEVVIAGDPEAADTRALVEAYWRAQPADAVVARIPAAGADPETLEALPALAGKTALGGKATAYVCRFGVCGAPQTTAEGMLSQLGARSGNR